MPDKGLFLFLLCSTLISYCVDISHFHIFTFNHMNLLSSIAAFLRNKYFLALTCFVAWMLFFDRDDVFTQLERKRELSQIKTSKAWYSKQIREDRNFSKDLQFNASAIEKLAREKYLMKRDNEDLYLIQPLENK